MITLSSLVTFLLSMALVGFVAWLLITYIPMPDVFKRVFLVVVAIVLLLWALRFLGLLV